MIAQNEQQDKKFTGASKMLIAVGAVLLVFLGVSAALIDDSNSNVLTALSSDELSKLEVSFSNEYTAVRGHPATDYTWVEDGKLVEPHKATNVLMSGIPDRFLQDASSFLSTSCTASHYGSAHVITGTANSVSCDILFTLPGKYRVDVSTKHSVLGEVGRKSTDVFSRYVRREIRVLSDADVANFMNAAHIMGQLSKEEGTARYGDAYRTVNFFVETHLANSVPDKTHDHMHDGMGFLSQHISITNEFESSLQSIYPSVSIPFWDYSQDLVVIRQKAKREGRAVDFADLWTQKIWGPTYFGTAAGSSLHTVTEGVWAYTEVPKKSFIKDKKNANPYGFMRAPWNLQNSPYVTRYHSLCGESIGGESSGVTNQWPGCAQHHQMVFNTTALAEVMYYASYDAHGGIHLMIGGTGGGGDESCDNWSDLADVVGSETVKAVKYEAPFLMRDVWRHGYCREPTDEECESGTDSCKMMCEGCEESEFTDAQLTKFRDTWEGYKTVKGDKLQRLTRAVFCDSKVLLGEQIEASSPADISFWTIHPTLERLLHYKELVQPITDFSWDASDYVSIWNDLCKWGKVFNTECTGHGELDISVGQVSILNKDTELFEKMFVTNRELMAVGKPANTINLPYVYEDFNFEHCEEDGITFKKVPKSANI